MSRVTSDLQITIPEALAERYGIRPGTAVEFVPAPDGLRLLVQSQEPAGPPAAGQLTPEQRVQLFDAMIERQRRWEQENPRPPAPPGEGRGWTRQDLYEPPRGWRP